ncbi:sugar kinase [Microbispora corallina]|uniref:Ribokinase n=1 Tax=Microbispora corallina TaxID=83302 RepID=A0ABQ4GBV4_9ACTN|nr:sugar kinase [Microbispora corallina]GIH44499.1 ribokinase [Microbispora corallina]
MIPDLVAVGEAMALVRGSGAGPLRPGSPAEISFAGSEANVAVGVSRLGHRGAWVGRLGDDDAGEMILTGLRGEGVDVSHVVRDAVRPTGLMMRHRRTADRVILAYYREHQAGAALSPADLPLDVIAGARILHVTGITPALGPTALAAVEAAVAAAREAGTTVSFDVNHRARLWSPEEAAPVLRRLAAAADVIFAGEWEAAILLGGERGPNDAAEGLLGLGPREAVVKLGADGALARTAGDLARVAAPPVTEIDPVGAGDAFVAGYLSCLLEGEDELRARLDRAAVCGAFAVSAYGDWEGFPRRRELGLLAPGDNVVR